MNARYLIINADDFGLTRAGDSAIRALFAAGRITSATILSPARFADNACTAAKEDHLPIGVHWTLHAEWAEERWLPSADASSVPSLVKDGALLSDAKRMAKATKSGDVTRELEAQLAYLGARGVTPDHADSHGGTLYGINGRLFFLNAFRVCQAEQLPFRFPRRAAFLGRQLGHEPGALLRVVHRAIVASADAHGVKLIDDLITNPYPAAKIGSLSALSAYYERALSQAGAGITEVFLHPSLCDDALLARTPEWQKRVWEYEFLSSDAFINLIDREGFQLCSWASAPFDEQRK